MEDECTRGPPTSTRVDGASLGRTDPGRVRTGVPAVEGLGSIANPVRSRGERVERTDTVERPTTTEIEKGIDEVER